MKKDNNLQATPKAPFLDALLDSLTGVSRVAAVAEGFCVMCSGDAEDFRDSLSKKEYTISGMCQECQDSIFGVSE